MCGGWVTLNSDTKLNTFCIGICLKTKDCEGSYFTCRVTLHQYPAQHHTSRQHNAVLVCSTILYKNISKSVVHTCYLRKAPHNVFCQAAYRAGTHSDEVLERLIFQYQNVYTLIKVSADVNLYTK